MTAVGQWNPTNLATDDRAFSVQLPRIFWGRPEVWMSLLHTVDTTTSHPRVWGFLAELVNATNAKVIVESGTYKGHGCFAMAEALWCTKQKGHIWSADIVDHHVDDALAEMGLLEYVSLAIGDFREMVKEQVIGPIDLAFVDASDPDNSRLRVEHVDFLLPRMRKHGLIVVDDCADEKGWPEAEFLRGMCDVYLPMGRGTCIFQKK